MRRQARCSTLHRGSVVQWQMRNETASSSSSSGRSPLTLLSLLQPAQRSSSSVQKSSKGTAATRTGVPLRRERSDTPSSSRVLQSSHCSCVAPPPPEEQAQAKQH
ncbi:hypothetical protein MTO96_000687 [Rhipicephalus appendiculatus]